MAQVNEAFLDNILQKIIRKKHVYSAVLCVESGDGHFSWTGATGDMQAGSRYFIASVTKLYVTAVVMRLIEKQKLALNDKIAAYLPVDFMDGLHVLDGKDYSDEITVRHLISNTSGLPDYFFHKQPDGKTAAATLLDGADESWHLEKTVATVKKLKPNFPPGKKRKAAYSDTNYQLLGKIIETVTGSTIGDVFREYLFDEIGLADTYTFSDASDKSPASFYYKSKKLWIPKYMESVTTEGGIVSTAQECMRFLKAFFDGRFFPKEHIEDMKDWKWILPPPGLFLFGVGLEKLWTPRIISPFKPIREVLGFWGQTGSFAWHHPETDLYFTGTTNQIDGSGHAAAGSAIFKIIKNTL